MGQDYEYYKWVPVPDYVKKIKANASDPIVYIGDLIESTRASDKTNITVLGDLSWNNNRLELSLNVDMWITSTELRRLGRFMDLTEQNIKKNLLASSKP